MPDPELPLPDIPLPRATSHPVWTLLQVAGLLSTGALVTGLIVRPVPTLQLFWQVVVPLLPALFLINPMLWRNVCPLATLNEWTGRGRGGRIDRGGLHAGWVVGMVLLALLVPARRFLFNHHGPALALTITSVGGVALGAGLRYPRRAGFCNTICPILPVEKLYGQAPVLALGGPRCRSCDLCTPAGCIDLAGRKSARQSLGGRRGVAWLRSPFGVFAAAFPGLIVAYFTMVDGGLATAGAGYLRAAAWVLASYLVVAALVAGLRPAATTALPMLGALAAGLYYWWAAPGMGTALGLNDPAPVLLRGLAVGLVALWLRQALTRPPPLGTIPLSAPRAS